MAFYTIVRKLCRAYPKHFLPLVQPVTQPSFSSFFSSPQIEHFCQAFYRTPQFLSTNSHFSTLRSSHYQNLDKLIDFSELFNDPNQNDQLGVHELVGTVKDAGKFSTLEEAIGFFENIGVEPSEELVLRLIVALRNDWELALLAFKWGQKRGCVGENVWASIVWVLGSCKEFDKAWCLIKDMYQASVDTRRAMLVMIDRYAAANDTYKAVHTFETMETFRTTADVEAYQTLLHCLCKQGNVEEAEEFMHSNKKLFPLEADTFNIILNGWCNVSVDVYEAKRIWREMSKHCIHPNGTSYVHMISCFSKVGNLFDSLRLYDEMKKRDWVPGLEVYNSLVFVLTRENCLQQALKILEKMKEAGVEPNSSTYNAMIGPLCEAMKLDDARNILDLMVKENIDPTIETYHSLLEGTSVVETTEILSVMKKFGLGPKKDTFILIFRRFFKLKQPEYALKFWDEMKRYEVEVDRVHYCILVEGLVSCGLLIKARAVYAEMIERGFLNDPKLKKLLKEPEQSSSNPKENIPSRVVRSVRNDTEVYYKKGSEMRRQKRGKKLRNTTNVT